MISSRIWYTINVLSFPPLPFPSAIWQGGPWNANRLTLAHLAKQGCSSVLVTGGLFSWVFTINQSITELVVITSQL